MARAVKAAKCPGGAASDAGRKIEKVVRFGAVHFGASLVQQVSAVHSMWWYGHSSGVASGEQTEKTRKVMQYDAF